MHLKSLTLRGFKSFASATALTFEPGINCVVGPNGSGKSNVVDALAWVMGEQGAKNLRGGQMSDVIFAGTAKRPALGRAEVSLTIDNTDGLLPIDYSEVTITRTLFRSGGSEYAINGTSCRLLDIQELLSDTGMGKEMHVIIGQGKLDEVLTSTPEERRYFIEEAAGVLKHRRRKEKALRKLESMQGNLTRIEDLAGELRRQLGPLARQAATARRAQIIQRDVFDARARLLADDLAQAQARLSAQKVDDQEFITQREELAQKINTAISVVQSIEKEIAATSPKIGELTENWQRLTSLVERFRALVQLAEERQRSLNQPSGNIWRGESPAEIRERAAAAFSQEEEFAAAQSAAQEDLDAAVQAREKAEATEREIDSRLVVVSRELADRRESAARLSGKISTARSRIESLTAESARVKAAMQSAQQRALETADQVGKLEQDIVAHTDGDDTLSVWHEEAARRVSEVQSELVKLREMALEAATKSAEWRAKAETLELSLVPEDATAWVVDEHRLGVLGLVRDQLKIVSGWEAAVEAALSGVAAGAVMDSVDSAVDALRGARKNNCGHLELLVAAEQFLDAENSANTNSGVDFLREEQILAELNLSNSEAITAGAALSGKNPVNDVVRKILANTILAADLVVARKIVVAGASRVVTLAGDVLSANHISGGQVQADAVLARQALYEDARVAQKAAMEAKESAQANVAQVELELLEAQTEFEQVSAQLSARDSQLAAVTAQLGVLRQSLESAGEEVARNETRLARISQELISCEEDLALLNAQQDELNQDPKDNEARLAEISQAREVAHEHTVALRTAETQARLVLRTKEERLRAIAGKAAALENQAHSVEARIAQEERQAERRKMLANQAAQISELAQLALMRAQELLVNITNERENAENERVEKDENLAAARKDLEHLQTQQRVQDDLIHRRELVLAQLSAHYTQLVAKAIDDLGMEAETLIEEFGPHLLIEVISEESHQAEESHQEVKKVPFVRAEQEKRLARAERDLARLGKINPLALEEHAALEERQRFLTEQLQDLRSSREDLLKIVRDIDKRVNEVMQAAFVDVTNEFETTFTRLFPGGEGKLRLTDPDSPLTTGIDIEARPPGKRVKRLSLLSGGERSLTAIAFLVAIFKARPSPFYVMDEVEAALDDVNLSRLIEIFKELQNNSQLLVITHQKRTMEIADALYGVAMKEEGVTTVISQRLQELAE